MTRRLICLTFLIIAFGQATYANDSDSYLKSKVTEWAIDEQSSPHFTFATISTVDRANNPTSRIVEIIFDESNSILFFTHSNTRKAKQLIRNNNVAVNIWLPKTKKQITIEGKTDVLPKESLEEFWKKIPKPMQLRFISSDHTSPILEDSQLENKLYKNNLAFPNDIPMPKEFIGYTVKPNHYEFFEAIHGSFSNKTVANLFSGEWNIAKYEP